MLSANYDLDLGHSITPFVGAGIGLAFADLQIEVPSRIFQQDGTYFAYQLNAGASMSLTKKVDVFAQYQFFSIPNFSMNANMVGTPGAPDIVNMNFKDSYNSHNISMGIRYRF